MSRVFIYLFLITQISVLKSQDFNTDLMAVMAQQNKLEKQCYSITYTLRENHNYNSKVIYKSLGKYIKTKNTFLSMLDHITSVTMSDQVIMVDSEVKKIVISKNTKKVQAQLDVLKQLEGYNKNILKTVRTEISKNRFLYSIELKKNPSPISKYEIVIDNRSKSLVRLTLFYKGALPKDDDYHITGTEVPRLDIEFFNYNDFNVLKEIECSKSYYYNQNGNKLIPTYNFKDYEVKQL